MNKEKAHFQDADNLPVEADIHYLIRKEFGISYREYYHMCFEGSYVPEFIEFALELIIGRIDQKAEDDWIADDYIELIEQQIRHLSNSSNAKALSPNMKNSYDEIINKI